MNAALQGLFFFGRFARSFSRIGYERRAREWPPFQPDFSGQQWLVTGASGGIGRKILLEAVAAGAEAIAAARSATKLLDLKQGSKYPQRITDTSADLALKVGIDNLIEQIGSRGKQVDILVNNVGVLLNDFETTVEGLEASFATNLLNHFRLTEGLIQKGRLSSNAVVVNMSSGGMYNAPLSVDAMNPQNEDSYDGVMAYAYHKRAQVELTRYWNDTYGSGGRRFYVMHPGWVDTQGVKTSLPGFRKLFKSVLREPMEGADTALWLASQKPECKPNEGIWLDREKQPEHVFDSTRQSKVTTTELVKNLRSFDQ